MDNCSISSWRLLAEVPKWWLISFQVCSSKLESCSGLMHFEIFSSYPNVLNTASSTSFLLTPDAIFIFSPSMSNHSPTFNLSFLSFIASSYISLAVNDLDFLSSSPLSSILMIFKKISISFLGLSLEGIRHPSIVALTRTNGFLPHHLPKPVKVCPLFAFLSL